MRGQPTSGIGEQIALFPGEHPDELIAQARAEHQPIAAFCLFSGGHDSTVLAHRCREHYEELVFIDTGTAVPGVREFVNEYAAWIDKPLRILEHDHDEFRSLVLGIGEDRRAADWRPLGFPGPAQHGRAYNRLKEHQLERLLRETKAGHPRSARVLHLTGVRRAESQRRSRRAAITRKGGAVFANPLIDWTGCQMRAYRLEHDLPESDVAALLHRSGECNCGAFAAPGEREDLQALYPEWFEERIASLEREAAAAGVRACRWGERPLEAAVGDAGEMCTDCQLRFEAAA
jgi:3'-phosphoadenosine 5'-phosphosulfate sulfotransferase (PAPS reductase)/FAD synthetase